MLRENEGCYEGTKTDNLLKKTGDNPTLLQLLRTSCHQKILFGSWSINAK